MFIPYLITFTYLFVASRKQINNVSADDILDVMRNITATEVIYSLTAYYTFPSEFSLWRLASFFILQDVYFFCIHRLLHCYLPQLHRVHHAHLQPFYAWYGSPFEHIVLNVGSVAGPFLLVPNPAYILALLIPLQIYTSVNGHTLNSPHSEHHRNPNKRFGSIYLMDILFDTY